MTLIRSFIAARQASCPLLAITTPDQAATVDACIKASKATTPAFLWDVGRGLRPANEPAVQAMRAVLNGADPLTATIEPANFLIEYAPRLPELAVLYCFNVHRYLRDDTAAGATYATAIWNLRDQFKGDTRTLVLLGPSFTLPTELQSDVLVLDEALPGPEDLTAIIQRITDSEDFTLPPTEMTKAVDALRGLAAFPAEQAVAMSTDGETKTVNISGLWERKRQMIAATPGLSVWQGTERFSDVGGNTNVKDFLTRLKDGEDPFRVVVFIDEIDKQMAGATGGDNTGVAQAQHGKLLTYMEDRNVTGLRFIGPPGAGKSAVAKAIGGEAGVLTVAWDMGSTKGSLVGLSEERTDIVLKVIDAVGSGSALFVATCNRDGMLSPELLRRFAQAFFFDLPDREEQDAIWPIWLAKYGHAADTPRPDYTDWTGAEIRQACKWAYKLRMPLKDTAQYIVPVSRTAAKEIEALRQQANGRFLSASKPGIYTLPDSTADIIAEASRPARKLGGKDV